MFHHSLHISPYLSVKHIRIAIWSIWGCFLVSPMFGQSNMQIPNSCCRSKILKQILVVWFLNPIFTGIVIPNRKINWIGKWNKFPSRNLWSLFHRRSSNRKLLRFRMQLCVCSFPSNRRCGRFSSWAEGGTRSIRSIDPWIIMDSYVLGSKHQVYIYMCIYKWFGSSILKLDSL